MIKKLLLLFKILLPLTLFAVQKDQVVVKETFISPEIANFDCHAPSLIELSPGILCAVWKGGPGTGQSNVDMKQNVGIWISFFKDSRWSTPEQIVYSANSVCWNPILCKQSSNELMLFYRLGKDPRNTVSICKSSFDGGQSWPKEELLPAGIVGPTKSKPLIDNGDIICGSSVEVGDPSDEYKATACWIEILSNQNWSKYGPIEIPGKKFGCIEPALFMNENGLLKMLCRDRANRIHAEGWIWSAESKDMGKTWSELKKTNLPNPDAPIEVLPLNHQHILLIYNHSHTNRYPLSIALSKNGGNSWDFLFNIEEGSGEFPSAILDSKGRVHIAYAWIPPGKNQRQIKHMILDTEKIIHEPVETVAPTPAVEEPPPAPAPSPRPRRVRRR